MNETEKTIAAKLLKAITDAMPGSERAAIENYQFFCEAVWTRVKADQKPGAIGMLNAPSKID